MSLCRPQFVNWDIFYSERIISNNINTPNITAPIDLYLAVCLMIHKAMQN